MGERDRVASKWLRWLHCVGYVTSVIVLVEVAFVGFLGTRDWLADRQGKAALIEATRTHDTALQLDGDDWVDSTSVALLGTLPTIRDLAGNGFRFIAVPQLARYHYATAVFLHRADPQAHGVLRRIDVPTGQIVRSDFVMPAAAYRSLLRQVDTLTDGWDGKGASGCLDGTITAFDRVRGGGVTSGKGNCGEHYRQLRVIVLHAIRPYVAQADLAVDDDWYPER